MTVVDHYNMVRAELSDEPQTLRDIAESTGLDMCDTWASIIGLCQDHVAIGSSDYANRNGVRVYRLKKVSP